MKRRARATRRGRTKKRTKVGTKTKRRTYVGRKPFVSVVRTKFAETWNASSAFINDFWRYYQPSVNATAGFNNFAEYGVVFDEYRVRWIKFRFVPRFNELDMAGITGAGVLATMPQAVIIKDGASLLTPSGLWSSANLNLLLEDGRARCVTALKPINVVYKPKIEVPNAVGGGNRFQFMPWCKVTDTNLPLRGFHMFLHNQSFDGARFVNISFDVYVTMKIQFRGMR